MSFIASALKDKLKVHNTRVFTGTGNITMANEGVLIVNKASGAATTVTLTPHPEKGDHVTVKDGKGDAATNNITIQGAASATIDGNVSWVIQSNYGSFEFVYNGTEWNAVGVNTMAGGTTLTATGGITSNGRITTTDGVTSGTAKVVGGLAYSNTAASAAVTASSTETLFDKSYTMPANTLKAGTVVKVRFQGIVTAANSTDTLIITAYLGGLTGTALLTSSTTDATANDIFAGEVTLVCRDTGATGHFVASGSFTKVEAASGTATRVDAITASTAVDTTASKVIGVSAKWSTTNAGNSCRLDILTVEIY